MAYQLSWLADTLREAGLKVLEVKGWKTRGRAPLTTVRGIICHHTAGSIKGNMPSLDLVTRGRSDLPGPLSQLVLGRDGTFAVVAAGRSNHGGRGRWPFPKANIGTEANRLTIGIEAENIGTGKELWPEVQLDAYKRGCAAICKKLGLDPLVAIVGHKEYAPRRKIDPALINMDQFRKDVAALVKGSGGDDPARKMGASVPSA